MARSVIVSAVRTPFGRLGGGLAHLPATELGAIANYVGYVETASIAQQPLHSETAQLFERLQAETGAAGRHALSSPESVWDAIRAFFSRPAEVEV